MRANTKAGKLVTQLGAQACAILNEKADELTIAEAYQAGKLAYEVLNKLRNLLRD